MFEKGSTTGWNQNAVVTVFLILALMVFVIIGYAIYLETKRRKEIIRNRRGLSAKGKKHPSETDLRSDEFRKHPHTTEECYK